jgi:biopolymer transport protein ExbD
MEEKPFDGLNMVPFIDIMLVLLTIVLTTSSFIATGKIPIKLPEASASSSAEDKKDELEIIELDSKGKIYLDAGLISLRELEEKLAPMDKKTHFLLRADKEVRLQSFVEVADLLKRLTFTKVAVQTQTVDPPNASTPPRPQSQAPPQVEATPSPSSAEGETSAQSEPASQLTPSSSAASSPSESSSPLESSSSSEGVAPSISSSPLESPSSSTEDESLEESESESQSLPSSPALSSPSDSANDALTD